MVLNIIRNIVTFTILNSWWIARVNMPKGASLHRMAMWSHSSKFKSIAWIQRALLLEMKGGEWEAVTYCMCHLEMKHSGRQIHPPDLKILTQWFVKLIKPGHFHNNASIFNLTVIVNVLLCLHTQNECLSLSGQGDSGPAGQKGMSGLKGSKVISCISVALFQIYLDKY